MAKKGTLKIGDTIIAGSAWGKVRSIMNQNKEQIKETEPGKPFQVCFFTTYIPSSCVILFVS